MGVSIFLKKVKIPLTSFTNQIREAKSSEIGLDNLNCLKKILPDRNEVNAIQTYCKENIDSGQLSKADQFIKILTEIPNYELIINLMHFEEEFDELVSKLEIPFKIYAKCSEILLKSESLKLFLAIVLASGNFINHNSYCGKAIGFKINILPKLSDVKTNNLSINFLHVIVEQFDKIEKDQRIDFVEDLKDLGLVTKFVFNRTVNFSFQKNNSK